MQAGVVPAVSSSWQVKDVPQPQPGPNQVLVKMHASGICYTDVHQTLGHLPGSFPRILGHEPVGEIVAVAPDVTTRKVGDRVGTAWIQSTCGRCEWCQRGRRMFCPYLKSTGTEAQGGHAEYMLMNANATYLIPDKVSYEQAAPIFCAGYTVYSGLRCADPKPLSVSLMDLISKRIRIIGSQQNGPEYLYEALDFVAQGKVKTIVETYPLADAPKAYDRVAEGKARFRAVLTM